VRWSDDSRYISFVSNSGDPINKIIDLETLEGIECPKSVIFPCNTSLIICSTTEPKNDKPAFLEIYNVNDLLHSLYRYECEDVFEKLEIRLFKNGAFIAVIIKSESKDEQSFVLKYNKKNNCIHRITDFMKGRINAINERGWSAVRVGEDKTFVYDNKGKEVLQCISNHLYKYNTGYSVFSCRQNEINISIKQDCTRPHYCLSVPLYTQKDLATCDALLREVSCQQYALLDTVYSCFDQRAEDGSFCVKRNTVLQGILESFAPNHQQFLKDKLRLSIEH
jgi:hypothetical protein